MRTRLKLQRALSCSPLKPPRCMDQFGRSQGKSIELCIRSMSFASLLQSSISSLTISIQTPLSPNQVTTLLSKSIKFNSCPSKNRLLPEGYHPHPRLYLSRLVPGEEAGMSFPYPEIGQGKRLYGVTTTAVIVTKTQATTRR